MKPLALRIALVVVASSFAVGCTNFQAKWTYPWDGGRLHRSAASHKLTIAVMPFEDDRPLENSNAGFYVAMIPLVPYGTAVFNRPEAASVYSYGFEMPDDLARAAEDSLRRSGMVRRSFFTYGSDLDEADYVLRGVTNSTTYKRTVTFYGLSLPGDLLWLLGFPTGNNEVSLDLNLRLESPDGQVHWEFASTEHLKKTQWIYAQGTTRVLKDLPSLMENTMNDALADLESHMPRLVAAAAAAAGPR